MSSNATILLAHGSSDPNWLAPFQALSERIQSGLSQPSQAPTQPQNPVVLAYMELAEPSLEQRVAELVEHGASHIDVLPLFFAAGRHLRKDVPNQIAALQQQWPVTITLHPPVGLEPEVSNAISQVVIRLLQQNS